MNKYKRIVLVAAIVVLFGGSVYLILDFDKNAQSVTSTMAEQVKGKKEVAGLNQKDDSLTKTDTQGAVAVKATIIPEKSNTNQLVFELVLNTHSVDLSKYNITKASKIVFDEREESQEFIWKTSSEDSHHMSGVLTWDGLVTVDFKEVSLKLEQIDNIPVRTFSWTNDDIYQSDKEGEQ
ncbi:hypothetical protein [Mesobacillus sp.]|uniref:hypothetical protein n=1 Tax=Mesobacillus sp. TaxID=2675271 RepID=UPI0039EF807F